ncbi:hypothetical protein [Azospirillum halopraeferens]|uniref:hypothetical protein n=1 Tax=Azospirillum halopraeferens TaxID=34010 RepID=UPI000688502B|nr:hypothetical protein [Azospirillum halopraeferens]
MKVVQPPVAPVPERKPEPPPLPQAAAAESGFRAVLADSRKAPPPPARKPEPPASPVPSSPPLPGTKPVASLFLANTAGAGTPPLPGRKPETAPALAFAPLPEAKPAVPPPPGETAAARLALASRQVSGLSGHSPAAILAQASQESGLNPAARSRTSSAAGAFQFLERTWLDLIRRHGSAYGLGDLARQIENRNGLPVVKDAAARKRILELRHDIDLAAGMAARYLAEGRERLTARLKRPVSETESRIAYVMGVAGAAKLIRAAETTPGARAAELLPAAAKANHNLFYDRASGRALSASETIGRLAHRMDTEQRALFAAMDRAAEGRTVLDGGPSPMGSFRAVSAPDDEADSGLA